MLASGTESAVVYSNAESSEAAAAELAEGLVQAGFTGRPHVLVLFASPRHDQPALLRAIHASIRPEILVGASSAGEFTGETQGQGLACALALRSSSMKFSAGVAQGLSGNRATVARDLLARFEGIHRTDFAYHSALVMTDALAGHADDLVEQLTLQTSGRYQFFGGGAGDNANFQRTSVFFGTEVLSDAVVGLEILSNKPIGIGVAHGWQPASKGMRVTAAEGMRLISLNGLPAAQLFAEHAKATGQSFDPTHPIPFFLHNIIGIETSGGYRLRVPLAVNADESVSCAAEIAPGSIVHIMRTSVTSAVQATTEAARSALQALVGEKPQVALFFDCVATRLRMGDAFGDELRALDAQLGSASFVGCNTHGQIARAPGQFSGFHNCTAVVCVLPQ